MDGHLPLLLFYSGACENATKTSDHLKKSLAKTLTHYYPFAGRVKDNLCVDCDDSGASFIEANVSCNMSDILDQLESDQLEKLLPFKDNKLKLYTGGIMVVVQANYFSCGGVAIGILQAFYGCASIFPPQDLPLQRLWRKSFANNVSLGDSVSKRFIFDDPTIATLRETIVNGPCLNRSTRSEAVTALIWGAAIATEREREDVKATNVALIPVDLRHKMNMASLEECIGNVAQAAIAKWPTEKVIDYNSIAAKLHEAIMMMDEKYARKLNEGGGFLNDLRELNEQISDSNVFFVTSLFRSPLYEADFGWGKPKWASSVMNFNNFIFCSDT
ncbi:hypothetical protein LWI29_026863 [Acer saccharum]|uniref:Uncharacterized protein n=1 Tax=Acer saccharum TaxID=4024 RepID=A0AA39TS72_ACESA|nr:hypothetical protein LWI29_026863 [Acer saccharum]